MQIEIYSKEYEQDSVVKSLVQEMEKAFDRVSGQILYKFPPIKEMDEPVIYPDVFAVIEGTGVFQIFCGDFTEAESRSFGQLFSNAERADTFVFSVLIKQKNLQKNRRNLKFCIETLKYLPMAHEDDEEELLFTSPERICHYIGKQAGLYNEFNKEAMAEAVACLEGATATIKPKERVIEEGDNTSRGYVLKHIESQIARFDDKQRAAALTLLDGPQRIRGLAGSGKTIILCLKAAYLHLCHPEKTIIYTFYTKSLYEYVRQLITRFYLKMSDGQLPDFDNSILIMHAWGGKNVPGVYYQACVDNGVQPKTYGSVSFASNPFEKACEDFIRLTQNDARKIYDYIIMDEAQDFPAAFYQLCRTIVKDDHLIWGYDELQNIFNVKIQNTKETFKNEFDQAGIDLDARMESPYEINDIVLQKSYRNVKEILVTAIAIGFGIYHSKLVQSLENNEHWEDFGFRVVEGDCSKEEKVTVIRPDENSPLAVPESLYKEDIICLYSADSFDEEVEYVCSEICRAVKEEGLRPDDIAVICMDDRWAKDYFKDIQECLVKDGIATNNLQDKNYVKGFSLENYVTLTTVYKAKGNEAAMVFVIGADVFNEAADSRIMRNKVFTAFTRAKVWLRISGWNLAGTALEKEILKLQDMDYVLEFTNISSYKLDRDWKKTKGEIERNRHFMEELQKLMETTGISEKEAVRMIEQPRSYKKAAMIRESMNYGSEEDE